MLGVVQAGLFLLQGFFEDGAMVLPAAAKKCTIEIRS